ncbi:GNAT family N-acetyltransferase [Leptolyngbya sp. AN02str]|uniref:GNAT family N-acetyltransferase n=1 Tax=Leptolyngbya sp. AN02str TaxID=3423363 RepID=UPI003D31C241
MSPWVGRSLKYWASKRIFKELDVLPAHGRQGLGRALVETVCQWAQQQGCQEMTLSTFRDIPWNAPFYAKLGFRLMDDSALTPALREIQQQEADYGLPIDDRVFMSRILG